MAESKGSRFLAYVPALLDALRSTHPVPMRPAEARAWIRSNVEVPEEDLTRFIENGKQSIFENQVPFLFGKGAFDRVSQTWPMGVDARRTRHASDDRGNMEPLRQSA